MSEPIESRGAAAGSTGAAAAAAALGHHHHHHHHQYQGSIEDIDRQLEALDQESDSDSESLEELDACENIEVVNRAGESADDQASSGLDVTVRYTICLFCKKPFQLKKELKKHLFEHMKNLKPMKEKKIVEKKFKCHKCFKTYTEKARAEKHMNKCKKVSKLLLDMSNTTSDGNRILSGGSDYEGGGGGDKKKGGKFREPTSPRSLVFDPESEQDERWEHRERNTVVHFDERNIARGGSTDESPTSPPPVSGGGAGGGGGRGGGGSYYQQFQRCK
ncbi:uncharacterized protein LOC135704001 isoform X2 [Ochlerotatus camptorhynchus]|uniref:uncharacterized protein LOC135704001 isoform X2 n=1 Tax=Ochlerotatus camptorhynchus TaxID=644619 RepID=UPI0031E359E1